MTQRNRTREALEIEFRGKMYYGERVIEGARKLDQYIIYEGRCLPDLKGYSPGEKDTTMLAIAKVMLSELVSGSLSTQPCSRFGL